ncbi:unnamed protein product [Rhizophagus irregularis]|nr:unnamed protein product [Rhizophagus irregularis]
MQQCWHSDPNERPTANDLYKIFERNSKLGYRHEESNPTKITELPDIGPATANNPDAIYRSRSLSAMIKSAESTRSLESQNICLKFSSKRKFNDSLFKADEINKKIKLPENNDYSMTELELDIDINIDIQSNNNGSAPKKI